MPSYSNITHDMRFVRYGNVTYRYAIFDIPVTDQKTLQNFEQLYRQGRMLLRFRTLEDEWESYRMLVETKDQEKVKRDLNKVTLGQLLVSNVVKRKVRERPYCNI